MAITHEQQNLINEFLDRLRTRAGEELDSVVLYGSAASESDCNHEHSDLNLLCLFRKLDAEVLERVRPALAWWLGEKQPVPTLLSSEELSRSTDVFTLEVLDLQRRHRVLYGKDEFLGLQIDPELHRLQAEHELRRSLLRLRRAYVATEGEPKRLIALMTESVTTFVLLFRHALIALGEQPPEHRVQVIETLAATLKFDGAPFRKALEVRESKGGILPGDAARTFANYLNAVERVTSEVDRQLEGHGKNL